MIKLNDEFKQGRLEFKQKNFIKALKHFDRIREGDDDYEYSLPFRISCLIELKRYVEALDYLNPLIEKNPYDELLWFDKVTCHIFLNEDKKAYGALEAIERIVDPNDKARLLFVAKFYNRLNDYPKVIEYCNKALEIDKDYKEALMEKSFAALRLDDMEMINEIADRLLDISDDDIFSLTPVLMLKLFSQDYRGFLDVLEGSDDDDVKAETANLLKSLLYNRICEDLSAQILLTRDIEISVDEALEIILEFKEKGKDCGMIYDAQYFVI